MQVNDAAALHIIKIGDADIEPHRLLQKQSFELTFFRKQTDPLFNGFFRVADVYLFSMQIELS